MPTVAQLHTRGDGRFAYLLVVEGLAQCWCDQPIDDDVELLHGSGSSSWIAEDGQTSNQDFVARYDDRVVKPGLIVPESVSWEADLRTGIPRDNTVEFGLVDYDGDVAQLFRAQTDQGTQITQPLSPRQDPAPLYRRSGGVSVGIWGKYLGAERIGPAGQRRHWWITPDDIPPGLDHQVDTTFENPQLPPLFLTTNPQEFAGRAVALYRLVYDEEAGEWPSWRDQYEGGSLVWKGKLADRGRIDKNGRTWKIEAFGDPAFLRKTLNRSRVGEFRTPIGQVNLADDERGIACWVVRNVLDIDEGAQAQGFDAQLFASQNDIPESATTGQAIAAHVAAVIGYAMNATPGQGNTEAVRGSAAFQTTANRRASLNTTPARSFNVQIEEQGVPQYATLHVFLHRKAWLAMGFDPVAQGSPAVTDEDSPTAIRFEERAMAEANLSDLDSTSGAGIEVIAPSAGYWLATMPTWPLGFSPAGDGIVLSNADYYTVNTGNLRTYQAAFDGDLAVLDPNVPGPLRVDVDQLYNQGQLARGASDTAFIDGVKTNAFGWWIFKGGRQQGGIVSGQIRVEDSEDEYAQVAMCSWVDDEGMIGVDSDGYCTIYIERWLDPREFGLPFDRMTDYWAVTTADGGIQCAPLAVLGYLTGLDHSQQVLTRILLSSGTATDWPNESQFPAPGQNQPLGATGVQLLAGDFERQDLGLNIPGAWVNFPSFVEVAQQTAETLIWGKQGFVGPIDSVAILSGLMAARGWVLGWSRQAGDKVPKWTLFSPFQLDVATAITLTESDLAGVSGDSASWHPEQDLRWEAPVDRTEMRYRWHPIDGDFRESIEGRSRDRGAQGRASNTVYQLENYDLVHPQDFAGQGGQYGWTVDWRNFWERDVADWYAQRHFPVTLTFSRPKGQFLYPGVLVRLSNQRAVNTEGTYGITDRLARVVMARHHLASREKGGSDLAGSVTVQLLVYDQAPDSIRYWAPSARVWTYDDSGSVLHCGGPWGGDWLGHGLARSDVEGFAEPSWSSVGGVATIRIYQSEDGGRTWPDSLQATADVVTVDTGADTIEITSLSGTIYRDMDKLVFLDSYANQDPSSWTRSVYSVVTDPDGTFGGTPGFPLI